MYRSVHLGWNGSTEIQSSGYITCGLVLFAFIYAMTATWICLTRNGAFSGRRSYSTMNIGRCV